ncbi:MAG: serpin family protein [Chlamydiota bacterium]|nr:serpin family protein [Chlamydiota bacterium]
MHPVTQGPSISPSESIVETKRQIENDHRPLTRRMNDFGFKLYSEVMQAKEGNALISTPSAFFSLAMAYLGATGNTFEEMKKTLEMPETIVEILKPIKILTENLSDGEIVNIANNIFVSDRIEVSKFYQDELLNVFGASSKQINFTENTQAAKTINQWVEDKTNNKIHQLVQADMFNKDTAAVLVNAIYLLADWKIPFNSRFTRDCEFYVDEDTSITTPMMYEKGYFNYYSNDDFSMIELPYKEADSKVRSLSMYIYLPHDGKNLSDIEAKLSSKNLSSWLRSTSSALVALKLPKFTVESTNYLSDGLKSLGMVDAFNDPEAEFSKITKHKDFKIDDVVQKTYIKVDETGTEAAAATTVSIANFATSVQPKPMRFYANKPFSFMAVDKISETVLFTGKVTNPAE